jgi:hypothetical protein
MEKVLKVEPAFQLDRRIEDVHTELSQVMGTLHLMSDKAMKADNEDSLGYFCDLLAGRINRIKVMLCDVVEDAEMASRGLYKQKGR